MKGGIRLTDKEITRVAKDYLSQISKTDRLIKRLTETVSGLRSSLVSQNYALKPDVVQTSGPTNTLESTMSKVFELEEVIDGQIDDLLTLTKEAADLLERVTELDQRNILTARYIQGKKWFAISEEVNYSISQVYKIHGQALLSFGKILLNIKDDSF